MKPECIKMEGTATFYPFAYLWNGAVSAFESAKTSPTGSNYHRVSAALFSAFAIEAHFNHIGESLWPFWEQVERNLSWESKSRFIGEKLNVKVDFGCRPFQTLRELFSFRDRLAHGKNQIIEISYAYRKPGDDSCKTDPDWLAKYWTDEMIEHVLADAWQVMESFHEKAGFNKATLHMIATGMFIEQGIG